MASEPVVRVPWGVRARLAVPASRAQRFRKASKILPGEIPPLKKDQSKSSSNPTCHHSRSPAMPARAGITVGSRLRVDGQFARIAPAISLLPQLRRFHGLGAVLVQHHITSEFFSSTLHGLYVLIFPRPVLGGSRCPCHLALP